MSRQEMLPIACVASPERGGVNAVLFEFAERAMAQGARLVGTVQKDTLRKDARHCDMDVLVLPDGPWIPISQPLGNAARGCRLDPIGLEESVAISLARLETGADLLIVNKFGKHEAEGRGFRDVISQALIRDVPVLVGLNRLNRDAFAEFVGGSATLLPLECEALLRWLAGLRPEIATAVAHRL